MSLLKGQKVTHPHTPFNPLLLQFIAKPPTDVAQEALDVMVGVRLSACAFLIVGFRLSNFEEHLIFLKSGERKPNSPFFTLN